MKTLIVGSTGMVGSAICKAFSKKKEFDVVSIARKDVDLVNQNAVKKYLAKMKPELIIIAAARVGGIYANRTYPAEFIYEI